MIAGNEAAAPAASISRRLIAQVDVTLEAYIGAAHMTVGELTGLKTDAVVPLDAQLNAAVELRLNGQLVARGELVAVEDKFGVRITDLAQWPD
jgi:flagellar motor switch protein FliN/FliY